MEYDSYLFGVVNAYQYGHLLHETVMALFHTILTFSGLSEGAGGAGGAAIAHKSNHSASAGRDGGGPDCVVAAGGGTKSVSFAGSNSSSVGVEPRRSK